MDEEEKQEDTTPLYPAGTFVRVLESAMAEGQAFSKDNLFSVEVHGWLWFIEQPDMDDDYTGLEQRYDCRSLATGEEGVWIHHEIEAYGEQGDATVQTG